VRFYPLEKLINLRDGYAQEFRIDHHGLLLIQRGGERYLIESLCPHRQHPLVTGTTDAATLQCPLHGYRFSLLNGELLHASEESCRALRVYELVYAGSEVGVDWNW
jgi:nitrite reductase/ring-hydroxylating ferredoxin subunit